MTTESVTIGDTTYTVSVRETGSVEVAAHVMTNNVRRAVLIQDKAFVAVMQMARRAWDKAKQPQEETA